QTAERFLPDPFSDLVVQASRLHPGEGRRDACASRVPGARLYRTGDRCRWLADGALEFLGRLDHQGKGRGYRIGLGGVEAALLSHPGVGEAAVTVRARGGAGGVSRLVAYVAGPEDRESEPLTAEALRRHLKDRLPEYMVPVRFLMLPALPRTPGGKIDRR